MRSYLVSPTRTPRGNLGCPVPTLMSSPTLPLVLPWVSMVDRKEGGWSEPQCWLPSGGEFLGIVYLFKFGEFHSNFRTGEI